MSLYLILIVVVISEERVLDDEGIVLFVVMIETGQFRRLQLLLLHYAGNDVRHVGDDCSIVEVGHVFGLAVTREDPQYYNYNKVQTD